MNSQVLFSYVTATCVVFYKYELLALRFVLDKFNDDLIYLFVINCSFPFRATSFSSPLAGAGGPARGAAAGAGGGRGGHSSSFGEMGLGRALQTLGSACYQILLEARCILCKSERIV